MVVAMVCFLIYASTRATAFTTAAPVTRRHGMSYRRVFATKLYAELPDIASMRVGEIRKELDSYGISTTSFLEKKEMVSALEKARAEGKTPVNGAGSSTSASGSGGNSTGGPSSSSSSGRRSERMKKEMENANSMKVGDLKKELQARGISTGSFFEKSEFVKAYAEAVVDGISKKGGAASGEPLDPEYRDVVMQKMVRGDPRLLQGTVIDVMASRR